MNICNEKQLTLTFDNDISISEPTKKTYPEIVFDFNLMFNTQLTEENMNNNNSMAILGDSLSVLKKMKDKSVQLIFADAPYNIGKDFGNNSDKRMSGIHLAIPVFSKGYRPKQGKVAP